MGGYLPTHGCPCYSQRSGRLTNAHVLPIDDEIQSYDDYFYIDPLHCHPPPLSVIRRRRLWLSDLEVEPFGLPCAHMGCRQFAFSERRVDEMHTKPPSRRMDSTTARGSAVGRNKLENEDFLQRLADRLEALEVGLEDLMVEARGRKKQAETQIGGSGRGRSVPESTKPNGGSSVRNPHRYRRPACPCAKKESCLSTQRRERSNWRKKELSPDDAAVIIQSRFRAYLVRRSQTLRHLRDLAIVKSTLKELKCLFSDVGYRRLLYRDPDERQRFSERAIALLLKVDSIQGSDSMIREARRSVSKELVGLLDSIDHLTAGSGGGRRGRPKRPSNSEEEGLGNEFGCHLRMPDEVGDTEGVCLSGREKLIANFASQISRRGDQEDDEEGEIAIEGLRDCRGRFVDREFDFSSATLHPEINRHVRKQCGLNADNRPTWRNRSRRRFASLRQLRREMEMEDMGLMDEMSRAGFGFLSSFGCC